MKKFDSYCSLEAANGILRHIDTRVLCMGWGRVHKFSGLATHTINNRKVGKDLGISMLLVTMHKIYIEHVLFGIKLLRDQGVSELCALVGLLCILCNS